MIDYIANNTLYTKNEVIEKIESGERELEDFYLDIVDTVKRKEQLGF
jgi:predicted DNA-binding protein